MFFRIARTGRRGVILGQARARRVRGLRERLRQGQQPHGYVVSSRGDSGFGSIGFRISSYSIAVKACVVVFIACLARVVGVVGVVGVYVSRMGGYSS